MASDNINVRIKGSLQSHVQQQLGPDGLYENASEYIRSLIRQDIKSSEESWQWLRNYLEPAFQADETQFRQVSAEDVIKRNREV